MSRILSKSDYNSILQGKSVVISTLDEYGIGYNVIPVLISYLESAKKRENSVSFSELKQFVEHFFDGSIPFASDINLVPSDIGNALLDEEFVRNETSKQQNPYYLSSLIAIKYRQENEVWWDVDELLSQLKEIRDGYI